MSREWRSEDGRTPIPGTSPELEVWLVVTDDAVPLSCDVLMVERLC